MNQHKDFRRFCDCCGVRRTTHKTTVRTPSASLSVYDTCGSCADDVRATLDVVDMVSA